MLKRIRYVSRQVEPMSEDAVDALVQAAASANEKASITGALVVADQVFFQIIEGPTEAIDHLFDKLTRDARHTDVTCLSSQHDREIRFFPSWSMRRVGADASSSASAMKALVRELPGANPTRSGEITNELASLMRSALRAA